MRAAVLLGCSRADAEDLVQTTLVRCYVSWGKVSGAADRDAYVYRMLVNGTPSLGSARMRGPSSYSGSTPT